jgi:DNA-binding response OmpR family regulator
LSGIRGPAESEFESWELETGTLVDNRNRVLSRDRLLERVWGYERFIETRSVDVHVGRLRAKLGAAGQQIETVVGLGYRFVE